MERAINRIQEVWPWMGAQHIKDAISKTKSTQFKYLLDYLAKGMLQDTPYQPHYSINISAT